MGLGYFLQLALPRNRNLNSGLTPSPRVRFFSGDNCSYDLLKGRINRLNNLFRLTRHGSTSRK